jgi:hypothetical protein
VHGVDLQVGVEFVRACVVDRDGDAVGAVERGERTGEPDPLEQQFLVGNGAPREQLPGRGQWPKSRPSCAGGGSALPSRRASVVRAMVSTASARRPLFAAGSPKVTYWSWVMNRATSAAPMVNGAPPGSSAGSSTGPV